MFVNLVNVKNVLFKKYVHNILLEIIKGVNGYCLVSVSKIQIDAVYFSSGTNSHYTALYLGALQSAPL